MEDIFDGLGEKVDKIVEMLEEVEKALQGDDKDPIKEAAKAADIDLDNAMEPADRLHRTREDAEQEDKAATKFEEALEKKIMEMLDNG